MSDQDTQLQIHDMAWGRFQHIYHTENPLPTREVAHAGNLLTKLGLLILMLAAVVSGAWHTIPVLLGENPSGWAWVRAFAILISIDLGIFISAYLFIQNRMLLLKEGEDTVRHVNTLLKIALALPLAVALAANLYDTLFHWGYTFQPLTLVVSVLVGVSAPIQAWICGDALASLIAEDVIRQRQFDGQYRRDMQTYREAMMAAWEVKKPDFTRKAKMDIAAPALVSGELSDVRSDIRRTRTANGQRSSDSVQKVIQYQQANPAAANLTTRALAKELGVSPDTVSRARRQMQADNQDTQPANIVEEVEA